MRIARELFGAERVDPFHESTAVFRGAPILMGGGAFAVVAREGGVPFLDGRPSQQVFRETLARHGAVVNEPFARRFGVATGERIELTTPAGPIEREVVGVYQDFSGHTGRVVVDVADYLALYPDEGPENVAIFLGKDDVSAARSALAAALGEHYVVEILAGKEVRAEVLAVFERTFAVTVALQLIASLVAGLAVILVLCALVHERRRDLALVRVLGGSRLQLGGMVVGEALLLGLAGALGGLVVGLLVGYVLVAIVNLQSFGWTLRFAPPLSILWSVAAVLPACLLAGLVPAWLSLRDPPQEALREA